MDYILVPIGGGGLCTGVSTLAKLLNPKIKVIGVEPAGANCMQESLKQGKVVTLPAVNTIADGTAVKTPGRYDLPVYSEKCGRHHHRGGRGAHCGVPGYDGESQDGGGEFRPSDRGGLKASECDRKRRWSPS